MDLRNIRQRFESGKAGDEEKEKEKESPRILSPTEKSSLKRSESIHQKMLKWVFVVFLLLTNLFYS